MIINKFVSLIELVYKHKYVGHINIRTTKECNFFGPNSEYVMSGSDDGNFYIWDKKTENLVSLTKGKR